MKPDCRPFNQRSCGRGHGSSWLNRAQRGMKRWRFCMKNEKAIRHAFGHYRNVGHGFSWNLPLRNCQMETILKYKKAVGFSEKTAKRDIFWSLFMVWEDYERGTA